MLEKNDFKSHNPQKNELVESFYYHLFWSVLAAKLKCVIVTAQSVKSMNYLFGLYWMFSADSAW